MALPENSCSGIEFEIAQRIACFEYFCCKGSSVCIANPVADSTFGLYSHLILISKNGY